MRAVLFVFVVVLLAVAVAGKSRDDPVGRVTSYSRGSRCSAAYFIDSVPDSNCHQLLCAPFGNSSVISTCSFFPPPKNILLAATLYEFADAACKNLTHVTRFVGCLPRVCECVCQCIHPCRAQLRDLGMPRPTAGVCERVMYLKTRPCAWSAIRTRHALACQAPQRCATL